MPVCMGDETICTDGLVGGERERFILSFGEDEEGELYMLTTSRARPTQSSGVVYRIVDPSRSAFLVLILHNITVYCTRCQSILYEAV